MKKRLNQFVICMLVSLSFEAYSQKQSIVGFWEVERVEMGKKNVTPVAKWTRINADGTFQSGNGWLQNAKGSWNYDVEKNTLSMVDSLDVFDEFGAFRIAFSNERMLWAREEEGMTVKVTLVPIDELPMSPADYLEGIWDLIEITENQTSILSDFDRENKHRLHIRWDRVYVNFSATGQRLRGYWHIHGHRPEITFLPHQETEIPERWKVEVNRETLTMTGLSDSNHSIQRKYQRKNSF